MKHFTFHVNQHESSRILNALNFSIAYKHYLITGEDSYGYFIGRTVPTDCPSYERALAEDMEKAEMLKNKLIVWEDEE